jgi:hypothetical protein
MPYIEQEKRDAILAGARPQDAGELNFAITTLADNDLKNKGRIRYAHVNDVIGAIDCAKLELYRREASPSGAKPLDLGELNSAITTLVDNYLKDKGGDRYSHLNEVIGAMDCAKLELYRRVAAPYEDKKIEENGDVYECIEQSPRRSPVLQIEK